jgi:hypothetical protein
MTVINGQGTWGVRPTPSGAWVKPTDWLTMPAIGTQEFIGLLAVTDDESNHIALLCAGAYTVDWGDGVIENVASNTKAQHTYTYSAISEGTLSERGYKQVLVRVTPQVGQNLTTVNLQQQHSTLAKAHVTGWLDISINGANITSLPLGGGTVTHGMCERVVLGTLGSITSFGQLFYNFYALLSVSIDSSSLVTNFVQTFYGCFSLRTIPLINTAAGTNFTSMFQACVSLITIPLINTGSGTNFSGFFHSCSSLKSLPLLNLSNGTNFDGAFQSCTSMPFYPLFNTSKGTIFQQMFYLNTSLQQLPNLNTALGGNFANMLVGAPSIAKAAFQGTRYSISYASMCLSRNAIVEIFNGLGTAVGTPTVNVSSNPGRVALTSAEILIATSKGWTVV